MQVTTRPKDDASVLICYRVWLDWDKPFPYRHAPGPCTQVIKGEYLGTFFFLLYHVLFVFQSIKPEN